MGYTLTIHAKQMIIEREIKEEWIEQTLTNPDLVEEKENCTHYIKSISDFEDRKLRVITKIENNGIKIITLFFDRRLRKI